PGAAAPDLHRRQRRQRRCRRRGRGPAGAVREDGRDHRGHPADAHGLPVHPALLRQGRADRLREGLTATGPPPPAPPIHPPGRAAPAENRSRMIMPFVSRRQFTTALGVASVAALASAGAASAAPPENRGGGELLRRMHVPVGRSTADGPVWLPSPTGFAGVPTQ